MHQQLWGYKVEWKSVPRGTGGKKVEYHWSILYSPCYPQSPNYLLGARALKARDRSSSKCSETMALHVNRFGAKSIAQVI
jgi:hypothetical protein